MLKSGGGGIVFLRGSGIHCPVFAHDWGINDQDVSGSN